MIKDWKKKIRDYGFLPDAEHQSVLVRRVDFLEQTIFQVKLRLMPGKMNVRLGIGYTDKFRTDQFQELLVHANLRRGESPKHDAPGEYWEHGEGDAAWISLVEYGLPWLGHWSQPTVLLDYFEDHLKGKNAPGDHRVLGLLYYELGENEKACKHAREWLASVATGQGWAKERARTRRQIKTMHCAE